MFLFERVFGFSTYMIVLLFVCVLLAKTTAPCKQVLRFYLVCLCIMAFFYKPYITGDLYRIYETVDYFAGMDFPYFWRNFVLESSIPAARLLYWGIGKTGINALLPTFSAFACYSFIFYIIRKTQEIFSVSKGNVAYVLFFVMTTSIYISVIGGIRMMLALSMISFSFFRNTVEKRVTIFDIILYALSVFLHAMGLVVLGICVVVTLLDSKKHFVRKIGLAVIAGVVGIAFTRNFSDIVNAVYQKFLEYVSRDGYSDRWEYIMGFLIMVLLLMLAHEFLRIKKEKNYLVLKFNNAAMTLCLVIAALFSFEFSIFYRFGGHLAVLFSIPVMMVTLEKSRGRPSRILRSIDFKGLLLLFSMIIAFISCTRGSLSSLKFFEL